MVFGILTSFKNLPHNLGLNINIEYLSVSLLAPWKPAFYNNFFVIQVKLYPQMYT